MLDGWILGRSLAGVDEERLAARLGLTLALLVSGCGHPFQGSWELAPVGCPDGSRSTFVLEVGERYDVRTRSGAIVLGEPDRFEGIGRLCGCTLDFGEGSQHILGSSMHSDLEVSIWTGDFDNCGLDVLMFCTIADDRRSVRCDPRHPDGSCSHDVAILPCAQVAFARQSE